MFAWQRLQRAALLLVGDIDAEQALPILEREFAGWKPNKLPRRSVRVPAALPASTTLTFPSTSERLAVLVWPTVPAGHPDEDALTILERLVVRHARLPGLDRGQVVTWSRHMLEAGLWAIGVVPPAEQSLEEALVGAEAMISQVRAGQFEDSTLLDATQSYSLASLKGVERNQARLTLMADAFLAKRDWGVASSWLERLRAVTKEDVVRVANQYLAAPRVLVRAEPGEPKPTDVEAPRITPLEFVAGESSELSRQLLAVEVAKPPLPVVWRGRDFEVQNTAADTTISTANTDNALFEMELRWQMGSRSVPLICAALSALHEAGDGVVDAATRKRTWDTQGLSAISMCGTSEVRIKIEGLDEHYDKLWPQITRWLSGNGLTEAGWQQALAEHIHGREAQAAGRIRAALAAFAFEGTHSPYLAVPSSAQLRSGTIAAARRALASLLGTQNEVLYYGPRAASEVRTAPPASLRVPPPARRVTYEKRSRPHILLLEGRDGAALVNVQLPLGLLAEPLVPAAEALSKYWGGTGGRLPQALREARGLSYAAHAQLQLGAADGDHSRLMLSFEVEPDKVGETLELVLRIAMDDDIDAELFERTKGQLSEMYLGNWISPRELPATVAGWKRQGLDADPRPGRLTVLERLTPRDLSAMIRRGRASAPAISIVGSLARMDLPRLRAIGDVKTVTRDQILRE